MGVSVLLRLFRRSNVCNTANARKRIHEHNSIFKYTTIGPMIPKKMKYNLHYGNVRGRTVIVVPFFNCYVVVSNALSYLLDNIFLLDLALSDIHKLSEFRWVLEVLLL